MRKTIITLISLALVAAFSLQAVTVLAADPDTISRDELLGTWKGTVKITSSVDDTGWIADEEAKEQTATFQEPSWSDAPEGSLYLSGGPDSHSALHVVIDAEGMFDGYATHEIEYSDRLLEKEYFISGKITRQKDGLLMVREVRVDSVVTKYRNSEKIKQSVTYTYTMKPVNKSSSTTATPTVTPEEPIDFGTGQEKGRITFIQGRAYIHRNARIIPATVSESLMAGDLIVMDEGEVTIEGNEGGTLKFMGRTRFQLPEEVGVKKAPPSSISVFIGEIWTKTKELLRGESFEVKTPTGTCGVRG